MDGKHSMRLQNVNVYVWTGPYDIFFHLKREHAQEAKIIVLQSNSYPLSQSYRDSRNTKQNCFQCSIEYMNS